MHAVDASGVHPLLLAIGSERYTPYLNNKIPAEILTIANHILGTGQLSLAKFLFITADDTNQLSAHEVATYFKYILERIDLASDIHFYTKTTIDTLDYSGEKINNGSKVVIAAYGDVRRTLATKVPDVIKDLQVNAQLVLPGIIALNANLINTQGVQEKFKGLGADLLEKQGVVMLILTEDATWMGEHINNFLWASFTRTNPSHDMDGVDSYYEQKHWGCKGPLIFDATIKKHHAPILVKDPVVEKRVDEILAKYNF